MPCNQIRADAISFVLRGSDFQYHSAVERQYISLIIKCKSKNSEVITRQYAIVLSKYNILHIE